MTYWALNAFFLGIAALVGIAAVIVHRRRAKATTRPLVLTCIVSTAVLLATTAVFDNVMIGIGLVGYDPSKISGVFVGIAPLEDFSYSVAALVLLPSLWVLLGTRRARRALGAPSAPHASHGLTRKGRR